MIVGENDISDAEQIKLDVAEVISQFMCALDRSQLLFYCICLTVELTRLVCIIFSVNFLSPCIITNYHIHPI